jgi:acyl carrier protein
MPAELDGDTMGETRIAIVARTLPEPTSKLTPQTALGDLEIWNSLAQINIISEIEAEFGVSIPVEQVTDIQRIRGFLGLEKTL